MIVPLIIISVILDPYIGEVRAQRLPKKGHFVDAESVRKTEKSFKLSKYKCYTDETYHD